MAAATVSCIDEQIALLPRPGRRVRRDIDPPRAIRFVAHTDRIRDALRDRRRAGGSSSWPPARGSGPAMLAEQAGALARHRCLARDARAQPSRRGERQNIRYEVADAFAMRADPRLRPVFFGFFLSHVPPGRFEAFWGVLEGLLAPGGRVFFVDEGGHGLWREDWVDEEAGVVRRPLTDGTVHRAVKVLWSADDWQHACGLGWEASVTDRGTVLLGHAPPDSCICNYRWYDRSHASHHRRRHHHAAAHPRARSGRRTPSGRSRA